MCRGGRFNTEFIAEKGLKLAILAQYPSPVAQLRRKTHDRTMRCLLQRIGLQTLSRKAKSALELESLDTVLFQNSQGTAVGFLQPFLFRTNPRIQQ